MELFSIRIQRTFQLVSTVVVNVSPFIISRRKSTRPLKTLVIVSPDCNFRIPTGLEAMEL